ncbi:MAG: hypothetical protein ACYS3N_14445, partial [Planctomycetota bacterium]
MCRKLILFVLVLSMVAANVTFGGNVMEIGITNGNDSVEEESSGNMYMTSSDLELPDGQVIGLRYLNVELPQGATIIEAYIVFTVDELEGDEPANLIIQGELVPDAPPFEAVDGYLRNRTTTNAVTKWSPEHYPTAGVKVQTSDIAAVIQELIDQDGWASGNALAIIISDDPDNPSVGLRTVVSSTGDRGGVLHIEYSSKFALLPDPADGSIYRDTWASLGWSPGETAASSDVYFSDNLADVQAGAEAAFQGNQSAAFFVVGFPGMPFPDGLVPGTTYYWRVDSIEADGTTKYEGNVWSFTITPKTAYAPEPADAAELVDLNVVLKWQPGFGAILHAVYFGDNFDDVNNAAGGLPQGNMSYNPGELTMAKTYYWRVDELEPPFTHKGDVWSFTTIGAVEAVDPANGAVDVKQTPILTWTPGIFADSHEVYFGADAASLELKASGSLGSESYEPAQLEWNTTYYWRIDEANNTNADSPWTGPLWSFTTANFLIIDDFEAYNDIDDGVEGSNRIYNAWIDGLVDPAKGGSQTGHFDPPFYEETVVHGGNKSMPLYYDNAVGKSEATLTLTSNRDWTVNGVDTLTIWYNGDAANAAETMYVILNGSATVDNDNPDATQA